MKLHVVLETFLTEFNKLGTLIATVPLSNKNFINSIDETKSVYSLNEWIASGT